MGYTIDIDCDYPSSDDERVLISAAQAGDANARERLVLAALPYARRNIRRLYRSVDSDELEDLMQEAVPVLYDCIDRYDLAHPARARLYVFAARYIETAASNYVRQTRGLYYTSCPPDVAQDLELDQSVLHRQLTTIVRSILATMSIRDRDILMSRHGSDQQHTRAEVARRYECAPHVIEYAEKRAIDRFRRALKAIGTFA